MCTDWARTSAATSLVRLLIKRTMMNPQVFWMTLTSPLCEGSWAVSRTNKSAQTRGTRRLKNWTRPWMISGLRSDKTRSRLRSSSRVRSLHRLTVAGEVVLRLPKENLAHSHRLRHTHTLSLPIYSVPFGQFSVAYILSSTSHLPVISRTLRVLLLYVLIVIISILVGFYSVESELAVHLLASIL